MARRKKKKISPVKTLILLLILVILLATYNTFVDGVTTVSPMDIMNTVFIMMTIGVVFYLGSSLVRSMWNHRRSYVFNKMMYGVADNDPKERLYFSDTSLVPFKETKEEADYKRFWKKL